MKKLCIYHGNCADGFTAAWVVNKKYPGIKLHAGVYGQEPPACAGLDVIMVDFSYSREVLIRIAGQASSVLILDHHQTAEKNLVGLPDNVTTYFDMYRSGAMMAWDYCFRGQPPSYLIKHVQDRDLWRFTIPGTKAFQANLFSYEYTLENWDSIADICADDYKYHEFIVAGESIERKHLKDINEFINVASYRRDVAGYHVPVLNAPYFWSSDACHIMAQDEPFAACYWDTPTGRTFSLRSDKNGLDVAEIAERFGGGGHKHASGFQLPRAEDGDRL